MTAIPSARPPVAAALLLSLAIAAAILWHFHGRFWWPVDEGVYAYVAQRLLAGDVLHRDLIDLHGGYVNLVHALAFRVFGEDLLSLRYPLVLLTMIQALLAGLLLAPRGALAAAAAALAAAAFSFVQFLNPSANWYALFLFVLTCWALTRLDPARLRDAAAIGFLVGLCFLFRQLSGVLLAMGVLTWLLLRLPPAADAAARPRLARALIAVMALGLAGYLWSKGSVVGLLLFGIWPLGILGLAWRRVRAADRDVARLAVALAAGALAAGAPLALHQAIEGALVPWLRDLLLTALLIHGQDFIDKASYALPLLGAAAGIAGMSDPVAVLNGLLWLALLLAAPVLGALVLRGLAARDRRDGGIDERLRHPLPVVATFYALVAVHFQIPVYLTFAVLPVLLALLHLGSGRRPALAAGGLAMLAAVALACQAGQPPSRGLRGVLAGDRVALDSAAPLPRASLRIEESERVVYQALLDRIAAGARPDEPLFTLPMDPELNFMTARRTPVPYYGTPLGLRRPGDVAASLERLLAAAPLFVVYRRNDKYLTPLSAELLAEIRRRAPAPERIGPFDLYRLPSAPAPARPHAAPPRGRGSGGGP